MVSKSIYRHVLHNTSGGFSWVESYDSICIVACEAFKHNCGSSTMNIALEIQELGDDFIYYYVIKETP